MRVVLIVAASWCVIAAVVGLAVAKILSLNDRNARRPEDNDE